MFAFLSGSYNCYEYIRLNQSASEKDDFPHCLFPLLSHQPTASAFPQQYPLSPGCYSGEQHQQQQQQDLAIDSISSNFPHRRSRASRTLKNPPQPHICVIKGKEVFINVLSRI
ncbi:uncharacterized protein LOC129774945 [Toxorhynchites rutilus septentrionalis]|uniref:uncharacterized protein LOC129774945 n=1 Tax=Toxorhynchites rutilus septentrionalis TaxID=329112 RepID=UPI00247AB6AB|nr:uncharacterized protein LOC129774945 [Toxorhynchites rutilus septentrionalis]XP_055635026.1 uncharacterized protein LOC129774945 [Toxorhynchites rutilus septentrionalis]